MISQPPSVNQMIATRNLNREAPNLLIALQEVTSMLESRLALMPVYESAVAGVACEEARKAMASATE